MCEVAVSSHAKSVILAVVVLRIVAGERLDHLDDVSFVVVVSGSACCSTAAL